MAKRGDIEILLAAKDEASGKISALQHRMEKMHKQNSKFAKDAGPSLQLGKALALMGSIEAAAKSATAVSAAFRGEWEEAASAVKSLPLGIGGAATALEGLLGQITGANREIREMQKQAEASEKTNAARSAANERIREMKSQLDLQIALNTTTSSYTQEIIKIDAQEKSKLAKIKEQLDGARDLSDSQRRQIVELKEKVQLEAETARQKAMAEQAAKNQADTEKRLKAMAEERVKQTEKQTRYREALADLDAEIHQMRLRALGLESDAEQAAIQHRYAARIKAAQEANEAEKADRLAMLRDMELAELKSRQNVARAIPQLGAVSALESRFAQRAPGHGAYSPVRDAMRNLAQQQQQQTRTLAGKLDNLTAVVERNGRRNQGTGIGL